jgi:spermidine synthase
MLIVGNAAGTAARAYRELRPDVHIDGVELDGAVTEVGRKYFDLRDDNLDVHTADGRPYLAHAGDKRWDVMLVDAYRQPYIPFYLTTREFFSLAKDHLAPGGVLAINVGSTPGDTRIQQAVSATMRDVFCSVARARVVTYNEVIVATPECVDADELRQRLAADPLATSEDLSATFGHFADRLRMVDEDPDRVLTDDRAPVEWMTDRMIVGAADGE